MEKNKLELLRVNAYRWYLNEDINPSIPELSDKDYDKLEKEFIAEYGKRAINLVSLIKEKIVNDEVEAPLKKTFTDGDFVDNVIKSVKGLNKYIINYKYDGAAIRATYVCGKLKKIESTPDEDTCLDVTDKFIDFFPERVNEHITHIRGEVVTDPKIFGQKARNKANGLLCSKYLDDEINRYASIRAYFLTFDDGKYDYDRLLSELDKLPCNDKFKVADRLSLEDIPSEPINISPSGDSVLVDGVVIYAENKTFAIKFYFTEIQPTTITGIDWKYNEKNGSYVPTYLIKPVILNEKTIRKVATGGIANMIKNGGIGTETYVILSKMTIPKIFTNSKYVPKIVDGNYGNPVCECGEELDVELDCYGSALKCPDKKCSRRMSDKKNSYRADLGWEYNLNEVLGIDRFKVTGLTDELIEKLDNLKNIEDIEERELEFIKIFKSSFKLSELQCSLLELNAYSFVNCI